MNRLPETLRRKLDAREKSSALRQLPNSNALVDFVSNDYLGFAQLAAIFEETHQFLKDHNFAANGATGSRLLSGNHELYARAEKTIAEFHQSESALIFNSGYDANVGFFSSVLQKGDFILYDELCHASIRDGIQMAHAKAYKFAHNDLIDLERLLTKIQQETKATIYVATESVFSMDGDTPELEQLVAICEKYQAFLIVDEAHALGVFGENGEGLIQSLGLQNQVFARIMTFGKGLGCHGAAVLGNVGLRDYLVNFARSFIYTTGLSPHSIATILIAYEQLQSELLVREKLRSNIIFFNQQKQLLGMKPMFVRSKSAIQSAIIPGNEKVKNIAGQLQRNGFDVRAILSPTVPEGQERLRFCLHSYNSETEISTVLELLSQAIF